MEASTDSTPTVGEATKIDSSKIVNINVGILGHVDSGKTTLARTLSVMRSTACFDKNPQSQQRKITLDLGFSAFNIELTEERKTRNRQFVDYEQIQVTLVDCPGHASLIKTIIGGASIIDSMVLVVDATKGIQTQTAECMIVGEILMDSIVVVLNKIDMIPEEKREAQIEKLKNILKKTFGRTKFGAEIPIVTVAANPGCKSATDEDYVKNSLGVDTIVETLYDNLKLPKRNLDGNFLFSVDHCFQIKGQGTVMTGTVLKGKISEGEKVEIPEIGEVKKIKSMQMFRKPIKQIRQGDRAGICVTQLNSSVLERTLVCTPGSLQSLQAAIVLVEKIPYYKHEVKSKAKFHVTSGHQNVMGTFTFFSKRALSGSPLGSSILDKFSQNLLNSDGEAALTFDYDQEYYYEDDLPLLKGKKAENPNRIEEMFAVVQFDRSIQINLGELILGSKLDTDINLNQCRIAFKGRILTKLNVGTGDGLFGGLHVLKNKQKLGRVDRIVNDTDLIAKDFFKAKTDLTKFINRKVVLERTGNEGTIIGPFGQTGKVKISFPEGVFYVNPSLSKSSKEDDEEETKKTEETKTEPPTKEQLVGSRLVMNFKKHVFAKKGDIHQ
eukprot:CAMPEP_0114986610 /NCGR_PEP_ID=MMETSP0216-20121206/8523_1 /TAXON_ID=223996 /ORGANISM="Protocruzia adherens, Strain Boccale" /LENGTH=608 /DNA_ID=CAMNT_0002349067 /DNA_START=230 /DNA_END=2056 /DNA_ORIENTATION=+